MNWTLPLQSLRITTAPLSGPFLKAAFTKKTFLPERRTDFEEILLLKHELRSFVGGGVFVSDTLFLAALGVGVDIQRTTRHICCSRDIFCLVLLHLTLCRTIFVQIV